MTAAHELDGLVEEMLPAATEIAVCVRDRDADGVRDALGPLLDAGDRDRVAALIIALAVMVPDDATFGELVAWTHQDQLPYGELIIGPGEKWCGSCRQVRSRRTDFHKDASRRDGLYARCKVCVSGERQQQRKARSERGRREAAA
jgi:hypothetical protein